MYKNKAYNGTNNISGKNLKIYRKQLNLSQNGLAKLLLIEGLDLDKNAIQRSEAGTRFVTDIEVVAFCKALNLKYNDLLKS